MKIWLSYLVTKFISHPLILVIIITFLESLAFLGLILPGMVLMSTLGTLIGNGTLSFYLAWITSIIGCSLGDYLSYYIGWRCKKWIYKINIFQRKIHIFNKIKNILSKYSMITILLGKLIGPTRPLIPIMSGMLNIPIQKFILPSLIGCIIWPVLYFSPGIITALIIHHPICFYTKYSFIKFIIPTIPILVIILFITYNKFQNVNIQSIKKICNSIN